MLAQVGEGGDEPALTRARALEDEGNLAAAAGIYEDLVLRNPDNPEPRLALGMVRYRQTEYLSAIEQLEAAIAEKPDSAQACYYLGLAYSKLAEAETAKDWLELAVAYDPKMVQAWQQLAHVYYKDLGNLARAQECCETVCALWPEGAAGHFLRGLILQKQARYEEAIEAYRMAISLDPSHAEALNNLGDILLLQERFDEAVEVLEDSVRLRPQLLNPAMNLGCAYRHLGRFQDALLQFDRVFAREPSHFGTRWYRSHVLLAEQCFEEGWQDYEYRFHVGVVDFRPMPFPAWRGEALEGKTLLVCAEQGLGDEIMFASCLPDAMRRAQHCVIECNTRLESLFRRSFPSATVFGSKHEYAPSWLRQAPPIDCQIPAGSLPYHFRRHASDFPAHAGYLKADPEKVRYWAQRLAALGPGLKIGISWRGGTAKTRVRSRSIPLEAWEPILRQPGMHFVSLQYGDCGEELTQVQQAYGITVHHWQAAIDDYEETAALLCALDRVVSVCTAVVHLSGALGCSVWVLVPAVPEWRYTQNATSMPWYPSTRLFRQRVPGEWEPVVRQVAGELGARMARQRNH